MFNGGITGANQQQHHHPAQGPSNPQFQNVQQEQQRPSSSPPDPARAAAEAAERRAAGLSPGSAGSSEQQQSANRPSSSSGVYRSGGATFIWNTANSTNRDPPRPSNERVQSDPSQTGSNQQEQVPVRNLASFLSEAFSGPPRQSAQHQEADRQAQSYLQEGPAQRGNDRPGGQRFEGDPLSAFLSQLAGDMGVPLGGRQNENAEQAQAPEGQAQTQGQSSGRRGNARIFMTNPTGGGGIMTFTFGSGAGGSEEGQQGGGMAPFPFMPFMMGGQGGNPGQMGDYVFSQGALDK